VLAVAAKAVEAAMKLDQALAIAGKARIRRRIAAPSDNTEQVAPPPARPVALRDARGRYLKDWAGGPGRPPRDLLREAYVDDLFAVWKRHGRKAIRQLAEENPAAFLRIMVSLVRKLHKPSD
jgi:hypothetical protein